MLETLKKDALHCTACTLCATRKNIVFSDGSESAKIMLIGEAPGADEDKQGKPFVGRAGKLLDKLLELAGIVRERDLYIANTLKCRPPENRKPTQEEKLACGKFLMTQIDIVKPKVIILCGAVAMESFFKEKMQITKVRGKVLENVEQFSDIKFVPILHPSYLGRFHSMEEGSLRDLTIKDLIMIKKLAE